MASSSQTVPQVAGFQSAASDSLFIRAATETDVGGVAALVADLSDRSQAVMQSRLEKIVHAPWAGSEVDYGCVLDVGGEIAGFIGWTTATRRLRGQSYKFRNMTTWFVRETHRKASLTLARKALSLPNSTFTVLSATPVAMKLWKYFDFQTFEDGIRIVYPAPSLRGKRVSIVADHLADSLPEPLRRVHIDHLNSPCCQICLECEGEKCLVIGLRKARRPFSHTRILYASNRDFFARHIRGVALALCRHWRVATLRVESRLVGRVPFSRLRKLKSPLMFRSTSLSADDMDALYSEVVLMGL
ncbi:MAG TPA: hypothetical protein VGJ26_15340 [Pirellulales bacterium]|jgi:hypothetical protein